jgi:hypothetical protein
MRGVPHLSAPACGKTHDSAALTRRSAKPVGSRSALLGQKMRRANPAVGAAEPRDGDHPTGGQVFLYEVALAPSQDGLELGDRHPPRESVGVPVAAPASRAEVTGGPGAETTRTVGAAVVAQSTRWQGYAPEAANDKGDGGGQLELQHVGTSEERGRAIAKSSGLRNRPREAQRRCYQAALVQGDEVQRREDYCLCLRILLESTRSETPSI